MTTIIIGGGFAGLSAAFELALQKKHFTLIEKDPILGGNSKGYIIDGQKLDPGVIVFYEWYYSFLDMMFQINPEIKFNFSKET